MKSASRRNNGKKSSGGANIVNRRATFDYQLGDKIVAGIELTGREAKAIRMGRASLRGAYVVPRLNRQTNRHEMFLINFSITIPNQAPRGSGQAQSVVDTRERKLLLSRKQIDQFILERNKGNTIVPTKVLAGGHYIKVEIATGRGKKLHDKRQSIKQRDLSRDYR